MPNRIRAKNAKAAADSYAPRPNGSALTYGLIGAALLLVAAFLAGAFFRVDVLSNPLLLAGMTILAFLAGVVLRLWRQREHAEAYDVEYASRGPGQTAAESGKGPPPPATHGSPGPVAPDGPTTVTFRSPFLLPGLDRPHPPRKVSGVGAS